MYFRTARELLACVVAVVIIGTAVDAHLSRPPPGVDITEAGSPLYGIAVAESVKGLANKKDDGADAQGQVCPSCGKVHAAPGATPTVAGVANSAGGENSNYYYCDNCKQYHRQPADVRPKVGTIPSVIDLKVPAESGN